MTDIIGKNDDNNDVVYKNKGYESISPTKIRLSNGKIVTLDPNETCFELYNGSKATIIMLNVHPDKNTQMQFYHSVKIKPDEFAFLPHRYFIPYIDFIGNNSGEKIENIVINHGKAMFKGNKLPSAPTKWGNQF